MKGKIALIALLTDNVSQMVDFYRDTLGMSVQQDSGDYVEFAHEGVRFAICARTELIKLTNHPSFNKPSQGQAVELAFLCETPAAVDAAYAKIIEQGATPITAPAAMPWGQHAAFFADPEGNIHELFAEL
jgi:catechol 2,3-dioxygenase-like lactoylglutathione lyase family enzyme